MPQPDGDAIRMYHDLSIAGSRLIGALAEEASLGVRFNKRPNDEELRKRWMRARRVVEECQEVYCSLLEEYDFPEVAIRSLVEV